MNKNPLLAIFLSGLIAALAAYVAYKVLYPPRAAIVRTATAEVRASTVEGQPAHTLSILFIGNSYTFVNDLPGMLLQVASSDPDNHTVLQVREIVQGGAHLSQFLTPSTMDVLKSRHWDYVVLQQQSEWAMYPEGVQETYQSMAQFVPIIRAAGAKPLFYVTWARKPGSPSYPTEDGVALGDAASMQQTIDYYSKRIAQASGIDLIMAGDYWALAESKDRSLNLYLPDNSHPLPAGTFLNALLFFRYFTGMNPEGVAFAPNGLPARQAEELRQIAARGMDSAGQH